MNDAAAYNEDVPARTMILILDDEFDVLNIIRIGLQKSGFNAFGFTDPLLALEHLKVNAANYRLAISDIRMPGMTGFEFVREVKKINPTIAVLLMSAFEVNGNELLLTSLKSIKIEGIIQKPISLSKLRSIVRRQLNITIRSLKRSR